MVQFIGASTNFSALSVDDVYLQVIPPPDYIQGASSSTGGVVGTASWGVPNVPVLVYSNSLQSTFGGITAASATDAYDMNTDITVAFAQGINRGLPVAIWGTRVTDGTDALATAIPQGSITNGIRLNAVCSGILGNSLQYSISAGDYANTYTVKIIPPAVLGTVETFANIPAAGFWLALASAINFGLSSSRGPSNFVDAVGGGTNAVSGLPILGTGSFALGTDGRTGVTPAMLLGSNAAFPGTGLYSLLELNPPVTSAMISGISTASAGMTAALANFADTYGIWIGLPFPVGTTTAGGIVIQKAAAVASSYFNYVSGDYKFVLDTVNAMQRAIPETAIILGTKLALGPEQSVGNKQVYLITGNTRLASYTSLEIAQLENAGILVITSSIPRGAVYGVRHGQTTALNVAQRPIEWGGMTSFISNSAPQYFGQFVDELQSQQADDPLRDKVYTASVTFLQGLVANGQIDAYSVTCTFSKNGTAGNGVNTANSVAQHYLYVMWKVVYLSSVRFFIMTLQGGTTVVIDSASAS